MHKHRWPQQLTLATFAIFLAFYLFFLRLLWSTCNVRGINFGGGAWLLTSWARESNSVMCTLIVEVEWEVILSLLRYFQHLAFTLFAVGLCELWSLSGLYHLRSTHMHRKLSPGPSEQCGVPSGSFCTFLDALTSYVYSLLQHCLHPPGKIENIHTFLCFLQDFASVLLTFSHS